MLFRDLLLPGVVIPGVCAAIAVLTLVWGDRRRRGSTVGGGSAALGVAFASGAVALTGWPGWPPVSSTERLFYFTLVAAAVSAAWGWFAERNPPLWLRLALLAGLLPAMLKTPLEHSWSRGEAAAWLAVLLVAGWALGRALEAGREPGLVAVVVRTALLAGLAVVLGLSGTARLAQLAGALACGSFVVEALAWRAGRRPWLPGDGWALAVPVLGLLLGGYFYASLEPWNAVLVFAAFLLAGWSAGRALGWRLLPLLPLVVALALVAYAAATKEEDPYDYYGATEKRNIHSRAA